MAWWIAIQPAWRVADDGSFNYEVPEDEDWCALHKGGKAGLYTVVVALSWWVRALTPEIPGFRAWKAVHDVQWVIDKISTKYVSSGKKRQREESAPSGMSKRYVECSILILYMIYTNINLLIGVAVGKHKESQVVILVCIFPYSHWL